jgi:hypothetical protein
MFAVVNHLHLNVPIDQVAAEVQSEGFRLLSQYPGFIAAHLVKEGDDRCIVLILWESGAAAQAGANQFGPTWFNDHIIPRLASEQRRSAGPVVATTATTA